MPSGFCAPWPRAATVIDGYPSRALFDLFHALGLSPPFEVGVDLPRLFLLVTVSSLVYGTHIATGKNAKGDRSIFHMKILTTGILVPSV
jgi:hypothetical protein